PENMRAYDYYLKAKALIDMPCSTARFQQAREYCDHAIEIDPSYARARACKALGYAMEIWAMKARDLADWRRKGLECAETAVALDPMDSICHWSLGETTLQVRQFDRALDHMAQALVINPNDADVLAVSGLIHAIIGDPEAALRQIEMALERNPLNTPWYHF